MFNAARGKELLQGNILKNTRQKIISLLATFAPLFQKSTKSINTMAFKTNPIQDKNYESIESLFRDIRTKQVSSLWSHQADILKLYESNYLKSYNIALELPTGSGKTLIGLLIAEYLRRIKEEKVLFLCSTNQLVNQVVEQSNIKYGIKATGFTGSNVDYPKSDKSDYSTANTVAVTNYSSLFNSHPFFKDPDIIILDDAHVAENYIASNWSLLINRNEFEPIYKGILEILKGEFEYTGYAKLVDDNIDPFDINTVNLVPFQSLYPHLKQIFDFLNSVVDREKTRNIFYTWNNIKDHLTACQLYITWKSILIRPVIPPTLTINAFKNARQRIYMSATLGTGGDLERILGVKKIERIPMPKGWEKQGSGRRFFVFPDMNFNEEDKKNLFIESNKLFDRSLSLIPDYKRLEVYRNISEKELKYKVFDAQSIEKSKNEFIKTKKAVALVANRHTVQKLFDKF